jgi:hypothetical protein
MKTLFDPKFRTDDLELRRLLDTVQVRDFLDSLWSKYSPFVVEQKRFIDGLKAQPFTRIWEMFLGCALGECGLILDRKLEEGPDIKLSRPAVWVEAVASTDGRNANNNTQPASRTPEVLLSESMWGGPPEDDIIWRCATSVDEKRKKFDGYLNKGTINQAEQCVLGLNVYKTSFSQYDHQHTEHHIPLIAKVVFGYGKCVVLQFYPTNGFSQPFSSDRFDYKYRPYLNRSIITDIFFHEEASAISALIISKEGFWSWQNRIPSSLSENLTLVHNPLAKNPLPKKWLKSGYEIWIARGQLHKCTWRNGNEQSVKSFPLPYDLPAEIRAKLNTAGEA